MWPGGALYPFMFLRWMLSDLESTDGFLCGSRNHSDHVPIGTNFGKIVPFFVNGISVS